MTQKITRSTGIATGFPGLRAGAGYEGATQELDSIVADAAKILGEAYNMPVQIRFNTNRRSGGAWLETPGACDIGITAGLRPKTNEIWIAAYISGRALTDRALDNREGYHWSERPTIAAALAFVRANSKVPS